ncbi:response regulator [Aliiroseovarius sp. KMU-50]|uniref:Response regulator n=1 Tax=Aliiroseovarius salicola TaxID=3009082 RepID=A0ABT4W2B1_9RHOB|nr:response regulator [Aliiroseovarius sp. KMU-50]MDA5094640.1 response regulator [Aliiroseovarius sp. KMU-50]
MKILVVDDDLTALSLLEAALNLYGFKHITLASSAREAFYAIKHAEQPFDCFLLDYRMPEVDGVDLCARLRAFPEYKATPIIFVTAASDRISVNTAYAVGAVDYVSKPIDPQEIGVRVSIAEKLVLEERERKKQDVPRRHSFEAEERFPNFTIEDPVPIFGLNRVISSVALENYLESQGDGCKNDVVSILAINEFDEIYRKASPAFAYAVLREVAKVIADSLERTAPLISYNGYGEFICISKKTSTMTSGGHTRQINSRLARLNMRFEDTTPCKPTVLIGKPAKHSLWTSSTPSKLIEKALEASEGQNSPFRSAANSMKNATNCSSPVLNI